MSFILPNSSVNPLPNPFLNELVPFQAVCATLVIAEIPVPNAFAAELSTEEALSAKPLSLLKSLNSLDKLPTKLLNPPLLPTFFPN